MLSTVPNKLVATFLGLIFLGVGLFTLVGFYTWLNQNPDLWLDESLVAIALEGSQSSFELIGHTLTTTQHFPRLYLALIDLIGSATNPLAEELPVLGYRFIPSSLGIIATLVWLFQLWRATNRSLVLGLMAAGLAAAPIFWTIYATQFKQYSLDVLLTILAISISSKNLSDLFIEGRKRWLIPVVTIPLAISYVYPLALASRVAAWWITTARPIRKLNLSSLVAFMGFGVLAIGSLYVTDLRPNLSGSVGNQYFEKYVLEEPVKSGDYRRTWVLIDEYLFYWYSGLSPSLLAMIKLLFGLGCVLTLARWFRTNPPAHDPTRSGFSELFDQASTSILLLLGVALLSLLGIAPICPGRLLIFTQYSSQIVIILGVLSVTKPQFVPNRMSYIFKLSSVLTFCVGILVIVQMAGSYRAFLLSPMNGGDPRFMILAKPELRDWSPEAVRRFVSP